MNENLVSIEEKNIIDKCECYNYNGKKQHNILKMKMEKLSDNV